MKKGSSEYFTEKYLKKLTLPKKRFSPPILLAMIGPVGVGKSTVARLLAWRLNLVHVRTDDVRVFLRRYGVARKASLNRGVTVAQRVVRYLLLKGASVVLDADFLFPKRRTQIRTLAKSCGAGAYFIRVQAPERLILERLRKHRYTKKDLFRDAKEAIFIYFVRKKQYEGAKQAQRPFALVDNSRPLRGQIQAIAKKL